MKKTRALVLKCAFFIDVILKHISWKKRI